MKDTYELLRPSIQVTKDEVVEAGSEEHSQQSEVELVGSDRCPKKFIIGRLCSHLDLRAEEVGLNKDIQSYGMDSILYMRLGQEIEQEYSLRLTRRQMLELRTTSALAAFIESSQRGITKDAAAGTLAAGSSSVPAVKGGGGAAEVSEKILILDRFKNGEFTLEQLKKELRLEAQL
jgi:acyl carrier protein